MITYLTSKDVTPAPRIDGKSADSGKRETGSLKASFKRGSALLVAETDAGTRKYRVVWGKGEAGKARSIPVGRYRVMNISIEKEHRGELWTLSASGRRGPIVRIQEGKLAHLNFNDRIIGKPRMNFRRGKLLCLIGISGSNRMGITLLKGNQKVTIKYTALDEFGKALAKGAFGYV